MNKRNVSKCSMAAALLGAWLGGCSEGSTGDAQSTSAVEIDTGEAPRAQASDAGGHAPSDAGAPEAGGEPGASPGAEGYLLVAELAEGEEAIHVYSLPDLRHTGSLADLKLANHLGALVLEDGRVVMADDEHQQIVATELGAQGAPSVVARVDAELGAGAVWGCADADLKYFAVASGREDSDRQVANIVALDDFSLTAFEVQLNEVDGAHEELHPWIAGDPAYLLLGVGGEIEAYLLSDVLSGPGAAPLCEYPGPPRRARTGGVARRRGRVPLGGGRYRARRRRPRSDRAYRADPLGRRRARHGSQRAPAPVVGREVHLWRDHTQRTGRRRALGRASGRSSHRRF